MIASIALFTSGKPLSSIVNAFGWECRMAEITVKPSPALGMCKSVMRTSKLAVEMHFRASVTPPTATTSNPLDLSDSLIMSSTTSSSSTKRTLRIVCPSISIEATRHPSRITTTLTLAFGLISGLVHSDQVAYKLSRGPIFGNRFHHRTVVMCIECAAEQSTSAPLLRISSEGVENYTPVHREERMTLIAANGLLRPRDVGHH